MDEIPQIKYSDDDEFNEVLNIVPEDHHPLIHELIEEGWFDIQRVRTRLNHIYSEMLWLKKINEDPRRIKASTKGTFIRYYGRYEGHFEGDFYSENNFLYQADLIVFSNHFWSAVQLNAKEVLQGINQAIKQLRIHYSKQEVLDDLAIWLHYLMRFEMDIEKINYPYNLDLHKIHINPLTGNILECDDGTPVPMDLCWDLYSEYVRDPNWPDDEFIYTPPCWSLEKANSMKFNAYEFQYRALLASYSKDEKELRHKAIAVHPIILFIIEKGDGSLWENIRLLLESKPDRRQQGLLHIVEQAMDYIDKGRDNYVRNVHAKPYEQNWRNYEPLIQKTINDEIGQGGANLRSILTDLVIKQRVHKPASEVLLNIAFVVGMVSIGLLGAGLGGTVLVIAVEVIDVALTAASTFLNYAEEKDLQKMSRVAIVADIESAVDFDFGSPEEDLLWNVMLIVAILGISTWIRGGKKLAERGAKEMRRAKRRIKARRRTSRNIRANTRKDTVNRGTHQRTNEDRGIDTPGKSAESQHIEKTYKKSTMLEEDDRLTSKHTVRRLTQAGAGRKLPVILDSNGLPIQRYGRHRVGPAYKTMEEAQTHQQRIMQERLKSLKERAIKKGEDPNKITLTDKRIKVPNVMEVQIVDTETQEIVYQWVEISEVGQISNFGHTEAKMATRIDFEEVKHMNYEIHLNSNHTSCEGDNSCSLLLKSLAEKYDIDILYQYTTGKGGRRFFSRGFEPWSKQRTEVK